MASSRDADADLTAQLHTMELGEAAPWMGRRPLAWWNPPLFGLLGALLVLVIGLLHGVTYSIGLASVIASSWILTFLTNRRRGPRPSGRMPREFRRAVLLYSVGGVVIIAAVSTVALSFGTWWGAGLAFVLGWALAAAFAAMEARAASLLRDRLR